jgi:hypothetical protein
LIFELSAIVYSEGEAGESLNLTDKIVANTWFISNADVNADVDLDLRLYWESSASLNGFDSDNCYISHYTNGVWDIHSSTMAQAGADGMFSVSREGISSLSPFKVREGINSSLNEVYNNNSIKVWPVPASNLLNIESQSNIKDILVFDLESKLHIQEDGHDQNIKTIDLTYLLPGTYIVQVNGTIAQRIIINR